MVFGEVIDTTSACGPLSKSGGTSGDGADGSGVVPANIGGEVGGTEVIGIVGVRHHLRKNLDVFGSVSYDNMDAKLFRTGLTWKF